MQAHLAEYDVAPTHDLSAQPHADADSVRVLEGKKAFCADDYWCTPPPQPKRRKKKKPRLDFSHAGIPTEKDRVQKIQRP